MSAEHPELSHSLGLAAVLKYVSDRFHIFSNLLFNCMCIIITRKVKYFASNDKNHDKAAVVNADFKKM